MVTAKVSSDGNSKGLGERHGLKENPLLKRRRIFRGGERWDEKETQLQRHPRLLLRARSGIGFKRDGRLLNWLFPSAEASPRVASVR